MARATYQSSRHNFGVSVSQHSHDLGNMVHAHHPVTANCRSCCACGCIASSLTRRWDSCEQGCQPWIAQHSRQHRARLQRHERACPCALQFACILLWYTIWLASRAIIYCYLVPLSYRMCHAVWSEERSCSVFGHTRHNLTSTSASLSNVLRADAWAEASCSPAAGLLVLSGFCNTTIAEKFCHLYYLELPLGFGDAPRRSAHPQTSCPDTSHPRADSQLSMARI